MPMMLPILPDTVIRKDFEAVPGNVQVNNNNRSGRTISRFLSLISKLAP